MLPHRVIVADDYIAGLTFPPEILRSGSNDAALVKLVVLSDSSTFEDADVSADHASVADFDILVNVGEGMNCNVLSDLCLGMNEC